MSERPLTDESGVSETLGYIIIFGIVFTCIGMLVVSGNQAISDAEQRTSFQAIQQSFNVLSSDLRKTAFDAAPMRSIQIKYDGSMQFDPNDVRIAVDTDQGSVYQANIGSFSFIPGRQNQRLKLENDAVIESYGSGSQSIMSQEPRLYISNINNYKVLMISLINMEDITGATNTSSLGGTGICTINMRSTGSRQYTLPTTNKNIIISITTDNTNAWKIYFERKFPGSNPGIAGNVVTATIPNIDQVIVVEYNIGISMG